MSSDQTSEAVAVADGPRPQAPPEAPRRSAVAPTLDRPIFIVGTGRCGSTIFHQIFAHHPRVAFLSGLCLLYPDRPEYNRWGMQAMDVPLLNRWARRKFRPAEHWGFWERHIRGFSEPCRDLKADDVRPVVVRRIARVLGQMTTPRRNRLLVKLTGWPRTGFLSEIFPDALFIHMLRDGRSVINSNLNVDFWDGWRGPENWRWGELSPEHRQEWEASGKSFVVLAAIQWKILMDSFEEARRALPPGRYLQVKYEDFAADPRAAFGPILEFCGLDVPPAFHDAIGRFDVESTNYKWREDLTPRQRVLLENSLGDYLARYGYNV